MTFTGVDIIDAFRAGYRNAKERRFTNHLYYVQNPELWEAYDAGRNAAHDEMHAA